MKITHKLKPYRFNENEWRCLLIQHKNNDHKDITLALKLYIQKIKQNRYKIRYLLVCFQLTLQRDIIKNLSSQIRKLNENVRMEGQLEPLQDGLVSRWTENVLPQGRGRESLNHH